MLHVDWRADVNLCSQPNYVPPKKPYSFLTMLDDILAFAADTLVDGGRLSFWMPTSNDEAQEIPVPSHPCLEVVATCTQAFTKCKFASICPEPGVAMANMVRQGHAYSSRTSESQTRACPTQRLKTMR